MVTFSTRQQRQLTPMERDIVLESILYAHNHRQYHLYAACVMPDHVHLLFEPQVKEQDKEGKPMFWSLGEILSGLKSTTAHRINKAAKIRGVHVWEEESFDRLMRGDADLEEKFHYICRNPWDNGVVPLTENYKWLWTPDTTSGADASKGSREGAVGSARGGRDPHSTELSRDLFVEELNAPIQRPIKRLLLDTNRLLHLLLAHADFRENLAHCLREHVRELMKERLVKAKRAAVTHGAAQDATKDISPSFVGRLNPVGDREAQSADVVGDDAEGYIG